MSKENKTSDKRENGNDFISDVMVSSFDRFGAGIKKYGYDSEFRKECECLLKQLRHDELNEFFDRWDVPKN